MQRLQQTRTALGSQCLLTLILGNGIDPERLFNELWSLVDGFEQKFSRFLPDSETTLVNHNDGVPTKVSQDFIDLVELAKDFSLDTDKLFNPLILPALQKAGYVGSWPKPEEFNADQDYRNRKFLISAATIKLSSDTVCIPKGSALDFGGIGKGYLLDILAEYLEALNIDRYWLSLGGDIICKGHDVNGQEWEVVVDSAVSPGKSAGTIKNVDGQKFGIATSGIIKRKGEAWHHIIDPRSGEPAKTDILTATAVCATAVKADVYAKCLVILGSRSAKQFIADRTEVFRDYYLQLKSGEVKQSKYPSGGAI